jgi:hypothetical protein
MSNKYRKPNQPCYATDAGWHCSIKHELLVSWKGLKTAIQNDSEYVNQKQAEQQVEDPIEEQAEVVGEEVVEEQNVDQIEPQSKTKRRSKK